MLWLDGHVASVQPEAGHEYPYNSGPGFAALHPDYLSFKDAFYCPSARKVFRWDWAPWSLTTPPGKTFPWWSIGAGNRWRERDIGYMYLGRRPAFPGVVRDKTTSKWPRLAPNIPQTLNDDPRWPLWADRNEASNGRWVKANHPGYYQHVWTGFVAPDIPPEGGHVGLLDGSVSWKDLSAMYKKRYQPPNTCFWESMISMAW